LIEVAQPSTAVRRSAATISASGADGSFNDSGGGFLTAGFAVGDRVTAEGFDSAASNLTLGVIAAVTANKMTIAAPEGANIVNSPEGPVVTISKWVSRRSLLAALTVPFEAIRDMLADMLVEGDNITIEVDDAANTITISAAGGGDGGIADAPTDGQHYVRTDAAWAMTPKHVSLSQAAYDALVTKDPNTLYYIPEAP
jgi:hypothetical protein